MRDASLALSFRNSLSSDIADSFPQQSAGSGADVPPDVLQRICP